MSHQFLSDEWMTAAKAIREKYADQATKVTTVIRMNQVITDVPFGSGTVTAYLDTSSGDVVMDLGELDTPDLTVTTDWETARKIFVDGDQVVKDGKVLTIDVEAAHAVLAEAQVKGLAGARDRDYAKRTVDEMSPMVLPVAG